MMSMTTLRGSPTYKSEITDDFKVRKTLSKQAKCRTNERTDDCISYIYMIYYLNKPRFAFKIHTGC